MDNFFGFPRIFIGARELGVAVVGTARERIRWPPKDINNISDRQFKNS